MRKQLQLHEQSKTVFWVEIGVSEKSADTSTIGYKKICHAAKAN